MVIIHLFWGSSINWLLLGNGEQLLFSQRKLHHQGAAQVTTGNGGCQGEKVEGVGGSKPIQFFSPPNIFCEVIFWVHTLAELTMLTAQHFQSESKSFNFFSIQNKFKKKIGKGGSGGQLN